MENDQGHFYYPGLPFTDNLRELRGWLFFGGGVASYYAHEKGWLNMEKKEVEIEDKEKRPEEIQEIPQEAKEKKGKGEIGCILPF